MIDKSQIKPILEGQTGQEVADNMKANFDLLADNANGLDARIDGIIAQNAKLSLAVSPSEIYEKVSTSVSLKAYLSGSKERISILKGGTEIGHADDASTASANDNISTTTEYTAKATVKGRLLTATAKVHAYYPIFVGAGKVYTDVADVESCKVKPVRSTPKGDYKVQVSAEQKIFIAIHNSMDIDTSKVKSGGLLFPIEMTGTQSVYGTTYKIYESGVIKESSLVEFNIG